MQPVRRRYGCAALAIITGAIALGVAGCGAGSSGGSSSAASSGAGPARAIPVGVTASQLRTIAGSAGHPVFWAGAFHGTYELTTIADGRTYIRYLPPGVPVGSSHLFLTIGTYVRPSPPYRAVHSAALANHAIVQTLNGGELAVQYRARPQSVYLVFPRALYEVEVYDPSPATAMRLATTGKILAIS